MSFILDALRKSEAERRRGEIPGLEDNFGSAAPRRRSIWPILLTSALLLNGAAFGGWLLLRQEKPPLAETSSGELDRILAAKSAGPELLKNPATEPVPPAREGEPAVPAVPAADAKQVPKPPVESARPAVSTRSESPSASAVVKLEETKAPAVMETPAAPAVASLEEAGEPEPPAQVQPKQPPPAAVQAAVAAPVQAESFPLLSELPADVRSGLPGLNLQLHFFSPEPARRLVRLNGFNLREGDRGGDGLSVAEITPDGIRLSCRGVRFFLPTARR